MILPHQGRPATYRPEPRTDRLPTRRELLKLIDRQSWLIDQLTASRTHLPRLVAGLLCRKGMAVPVPPQDRGAAA